MHEINEGRANEIATKVYQIVDGCEGHEVSGALGTVMISGWLTAGILPDGVNKYLDAIKATYKCHYDKLYPQESQGADYDD